MADIQSDDSRQSVTFMEQLRVEAQAKIKAGERPPVIIPPGLDQPDWGAPVAPFYNPLGGAVTEPDEGPGWRVRMGVGLLADAPLNPALREAHRREDEREAQRAQLEAELQVDRDLERAAELRRQGHEFHSVADTLARASFGQDRTDAVERRREKEAAELLGQPEPRLNRWELKREQQREAEAVITPASKADVSKLSQSITSLASKVGLLGRRRSAEQESSEEYARNYGSGIRYRNSGQIIGGPY